MSIESGDVVRPRPDVDQEIVTSELRENRPDGGDNGGPDGQDPSRRKRRRGRRGGRRHRRRREDQTGQPRESVAAATTVESESAATVRYEEEIIAPELRETVTAPVPASRRSRGRSGPRDRDIAPVNPRVRDDALAKGDNQSDVQNDDDDVRIEDHETDDEVMEIGGDDTVAFDEDVRDAELFSPDETVRSSDDVEPHAEEEPELPVGKRAVVEESDDPRGGTTRGSSEMLINVADPEECRIAMVASGRLEELDMERTSAASHVGNIYKGRVTNVEPSIQAAFVDFGLPAHGFLHISDLHPQYFPSNRENEQVGRKTPRRDRPPIQRCLRRGQEVIVQITKEGIGTKGPTMTTYLSLPGRFLVMMPGMAQLGVSRKVEDEDQRRKARAALSQLKPPPDLGFIVRTAGIDRTKRELQHDLNYLVRLWRMIQKRIESQRAPCELYKESDLVIRTIRDVYTSDVSRIIVDDEAVARKVAEFLAIANPRGSDRVVWYTGREPLFHLYGIEAEIEKLHSRHVPLVCGGSLVIDPTEALVAIDVNSGRFRVQNDAEETARRVNLEAAGEIARQLRLRDLGGLIICDFIDMRLERHRREVERTLKDALKDHKERAKILKMSQFGIIEMTRQRQRPSISRAVYMDCGHCNGSGLVKTVDSMTLDVLRVIQLAAHREAINLIDVRISTAVASNLLNRRRRVLARLEADTGKTISITADPLFGPDQVIYSCIDKRGREVPLSLIAPAGLPGPGVRPHPLRPVAEPVAEKPLPAPRVSPRREPETREPQRREPPPREPQRKEPPRREAMSRESAVTPPPPRDAIKPAPPSPVMRSVPPKPVAPASGFFSGIELDTSRPAAPPRAVPTQPVRVIEPKRTRIPPPPPQEEKGFADGLFVETAEPAGASKETGEGKRGTTRRRTTKKKTSDSAVKKPARRKK